MPGEDGGTGAVRRWTRVRARVVFASFALGSPTVALERARAMAAAVGAELHVLGVLPATRAGRSGPTPQARDHGASALSFFAAAHERLADWVRRVVPELPTDERVVIEEGDFARVVARAAGELGAQMVVVPARHEPQGQRIARIAIDSGVPVLVAGAVGASRAIVAATRVADAACPVLRAARVLGERLDREVVAVRSVVPGTPLAIGASSARAPSMLVLERSGTADAILSAARYHDADLIVVGAGERAWLRALLSRGTAAELVDRADRSVLVTPLGSREQTVDPRAARVPLA